MSDSELPKRTSFCSALTEPNKSRNEIRKKQLALFVGRVEAGRHLDRDGVSRVRCEQSASSLFSNFLLVSASTPTAAWSTLAVVCFCPGASCCEQTINVCWCHVTSPGSRGALESRRRTLACFIGPSSVRDQFNRLPASLFRE